MQLNDGGSGARRWTRAGAAFFVVSVRSAVLLLSLIVHRRASHGPGPVPSIPEVNQLADSLSVVFWGHKPEQNHGPWHQRNVESNAVCESAGRPRGAKLQQNGTFSQKYNFDTVSFNISHFRAKADKVQKKKKKKLRS